jgi:hypothetical protein
MRNGARICFTLFLVFAARLDAGDAARKEGLDFFDTGPIRVREQFLIGMSYYAFDPSSADILGRGELRVEVVQSDTNTFARSDVVTHVLERRGDRGSVTLGDLRAAAPAHQRDGLYFADGEVTRTSVALRRGIGSGNEIAITLPLLRFSGGDLDGIVERFHGAFGLDDGGRIGAFRNRYTVYVRDASGREVFRDVATGTKLGDVALSLKTAIPIHSKRWKAAAETVVELPTGDRQNLFSSGGADYGTQLLVTRYFSRSCIHASAGVLHNAASAAFGTRAQTLASAMFGYEQALGRRTSAVAQFTASQSPFRKLAIEGLSSNAYLIDIGLKHAVTPRTVVFVAASENLVSYGSSADIGVHAGFTWTR